MFQTDSLVIRVRRKPFSLALLIGVGLRAYILVAPFTVWFALTSVVRLPVIVALVLLSVFSIVLILNGGRLVMLMYQDREDGLLFLFVLFVILSYVLGYQGLSLGRSLNHTVSYLFTIIAFYLVPKTLARYSGMSSNVIGRYIAISALLLTSVVLFEFVLLNTTNVDIRSALVLERVQSEFVMSPFKTSVGWVGHGPAEERGVLAWMVNILGLLALGQLQNSKTSMWYAFLAIYFAALIVTQSAAGIVSSLAGLILAVGITSIKVDSKRIVGRFTNVALTMLLIGVSVLFLTQISRISDYVPNEIIARITIDTDSSRSAEVRTAAWQGGVANWRERPLLGNGPGHGIDAGFAGYMSLPVRLLADTGILAVVLFYCFLTLVFGKLLVLSWKNRELVWTIAAFIAAVLHLSVVSSYYFAPFWIMLLFIQIRKSERDVQPFYGETVLYSLTNEHV